MIAVIKADSSDRGGLGSIPSAGRKQMVVGPTNHA